MVVIEDWPEKRGQEKSQYDSEEIRRGEKDRERCGGCDDYRIVNRCGVDGEGALPAIHITRIALSTHHTRITYNRTEHLSSAYSHPTLKQPNRRKKVQRLTFDLLSRVNSSPPATKSITIYRFE